MTDTADGARAELLALSLGYATAADDRDGERFAALFTEDGRLVVPRPPDRMAPAHTVSGAGRLRTVPSALARYEWTLHQVVDHRFVFPAPGGGPDSATGRVGGLAHHVRASSDPSGPAGTDTVWHFTYLDEYRRTGDGWRIARRELHLHWIEEHPVAWVAQRAGTAWGGGGPT